ncbi:MAG: aspartate aminotransferase family protein [Mesorhizobium sp.]|nr:MAG: aspartate aminotransferase family protein [Mesorhizobium sp.]
MTYQNYSLKQLQQIDAAHHLHPFTDHKEMRGAGSRIITHANGPFIYDSEGAEILDGMAGLWCVNIGYGRDELAEAAYAQMKELPYYNSFFKCSTPTPVFYGSSGSEANDTALRLVRHYWVLEGQPEKNRIISRKMAYHGSTVAGTSLGGMDGMHKQLNGAVPNIVHVMMPYAYELALPGESDHDFGLRAAGAVEEAILEAGADKVAAFIGEPVMGAGGVKIPPASYWPEVQRICRKYDVLLMLDEVITGYGRTGEWFAAQKLGIEPDTITTAKALTSGYQPLSALLVGDRIASTLVEKGGEFNHGYTYSGHPVACAVALKNLEIIEREGLVDRVRNDTGPYFAKALQERIAGHDLVGEVRSIGLMGAIEIVKDKATKERFLPAGSAAVTVRDHAIAHGMMLRATGDTMILSPPLIWTRDTIDMACDRISKALDLAQADLRKR